MKSKTFKREKRMKIRNNNKYDNSSFPSHHSEQRYSLPRERIFPKKKKKKKKKRNSRVLSPYFPQRMIVIYRFESMKFRSHRVRFLIKRLSLSLFSSLSAKNTPCFHPNDRTIFSSKIDSQQCSWIIPVIDINPVRWFLLDD